MLFLSLPLLISNVSSDHILIIAIVTVTPYFYLLSYHKTTRYTIQIIWVSPYHIATHFLLFERVRSIMQLPSISLNSPFTHPGSLQSIGNIIPGSRSMIFSHILAVLCASGRSPSLYGSFLTASLRIYSVLKWSGAYAKEHGSIRTASLHMSCVLKRTFNKKE